MSCFVDACCSVSRARSPDSIHHAFPKRLVPRNICTREWGSYLDLTYICRMTQRFALISARSRSAVCPRCLPWLRRLGVGIAQRCIDLCILLNMRFPDGSGFFSSVTCLKANSTRPIFSVDRVVRRQRYIEQSMSSAMARRTSHTYITKVTFSSCCFLQLAKASSSCFGLVDRSRQGRREPRRAPGQDIVVGPLSKYSQLRT